MDAEHIITALLGGGFTALLGGVAWWYTRKASKRKAEGEADNVAVSNAQKVLDMWESTVSFMEKRISTLEGKVEQLRKDNDEKDKRIDELEAEVAELRAWIVSQGLTPPPRKAKA